jgi:hypothetical protein
LGILFIRFFFEDEQLLILFVKVREEGEKLFLSELGARREGGSRREKAEAIDFFYVANVPSARVNIGVRKNNFLISLKGIHAREHGDSFYLRSGTVWKKVGRSRRNNIVGFEGMYLKCEHMIYRNVFVGITKRHHNARNKIMIEAKLCHALGELATGKRGAQIQDMRTLFCDHSPEVKLFEFRIEGVATRYIIKPSLFRKTSARRVGDMITTIGADAPWKHRTDAAHTPRRFLLFRGTIVLSCSKTGREKSEGKNEDKWEYKVFFHGRRV